MPAFLRSPRAEVRFSFHSWWNKPPLGSWKTMSFSLAFMTQWLCAAGMCVGYIGTHPAWWICVPLLVGLAGADWVRDPESRIRCGRAFIVALRNKSSRSFVLLIRQDTKPEQDAASKSCMCGARRAFTQHCIFTELYLFSAEWAILPLHCGLLNSCSCRRGKLNKDNTGKTLLMNRGCCLLCWLKRGKKNKKTKPTS